MRSGVDGNWRIIDVYLSGTVSELASRRSEFAAVLQRDGADGLVHLLEQRAAPGRSG
jgi:phospholipid transport system substrate-binding protein